MTSTERLHELIAALPPHLQEEVATYAQYLLDKNRPELEEPRRMRFYICPICFSASQVQLECHGHRMITCNAENPEDCKPPMTAEGELKARAPRWFITSTAPGRRA
ncbi:MAG: hypothetical protein ACK2U5_08185 [Candidatus Promineifilaceae bacterium]|jgi:hypothetical protein